MLTASKQDFLQISLIRAQLHILWLPGFKAHQPAVTAPPSLLSIISALPETCKTKHDAQASRRLFHMDMLLSPWPARCLPHLVHYI